MQILKGNWKMQKEKSTNNVNKQRLGLKMTDGRPFMTYALVCLVVISVSLTIGLIIFHSLKKQEKFAEAREEITAQVDATLVKGGGYAETLETIANYLKETDFDDEEKKTLFAVGVTRYRNTKDLTAAEHEVVEVKETLEGVYVPTDMFEKDMFDGKYSRYEVCLLAALIYCEMGGESIKGIMYAVSVVLNRVNSPYYPNTIEEVVYQAGQYEPALKGTINKYIDIYYYGNTDGLTEEKCEDYERTFEGVLHVLYAGSLLPENVLYQSLFPQASGVYEVVDGEYFCYK